MNELKTQQCVRCGADLPTNSGGGVCPRCAAAFLNDDPTQFTDDAAGAERPFAAPAVSELTPLFPQLEILALIGQGGMGAVYKARQKDLDRLAALKVLPPGIGGGAFEERFAREAKALARLNHPGIVTIYDFGRANGLFFFLMEFVDGVNLRHVLRSGRISPPEALAIVPEICDALQYAHNQGIVHRDIKPDNILLDRQGRVKVADFGLAKLLGTETAPSLTGGGAASAAGLTGADKVVGTPRYMAPEQIERPTEVDHRADIYALGVVFYQMLTGELPGRLLASPSKKVQIDVRLDEVVLRALEKEPSRRYQQFSEVKTAVETILQTPTANRQAEPSAGQGMTLPQVPAPSTGGRGRRFALASVGLLAVLAISFLLYWHPWERHGALQGALSSRPSKALPPLAR
jgi:serine/threonine protein kinase